MTIHTIVFYGVHPKLMSILKSTTGKAVPGEVSFSYGFVFVNETRNLISVNGICFKNLYIFERVILLNLK